MQTELQSEREREREKRERERERERERLEIEIAEGSETELKLWKNSSLEIVKMGAISRKQKYTVLSKSMGRTQAGVKYRNIVFMYSPYISSANPDSFLIPQLTLVELEILADSSTMEKWLKPNRESTLQKQTEQEAQKKKTMSIEEFNKRPALVVIRLGNFKDVCNKILKQ